MKSNILSIDGIEELSTEQAEIINGGSLLAYFAVYILAEAALNPYAHYKAFMDGFNEGYN